MTNKEKSDILALREKGFTLPKIASELCLPINTVKSFLYRKSQPAAEDGTVAEPTTPLPMPPLSSDRVVRPCLYCGKDVEQLPHHKTKSSAARSAASSGGMNIRISPKADQSPKGLSLSDNHTALFPRYFSQKLLLRSLDIVGRKR